jgi:hypothetical protein
MLCHNVLLYVEKEEKEKPVSSAIRALLGEAR